VDALHLPCLHLHGLAGPLGDYVEEEASDDMQTDRTIPVEDTDQDQMDTLEEDILSDQMETSDNDMQSDQMDSLEEDPPARGDEDMEGGGRPPKRRKVETGMTNLQIESCLKD
jgi:cobalamin biosynthesis protein CobT